MPEFSGRTRRWTRAEYEHLIEIGIFRPGEPVELMDGDLVVSEPQSSAHYTAICLVEDALHAALPPGWLVRTQGPLALDDDSEPEPDIALVQGARRAYALQHPARPALLVEVAESNLALDRDYKGSLYARARLDDYWIVNLVDRVLEICRRPVPDSSAPYGWRYASHVTLAPDASVELLAVPGLRVRVGDLLP
jgi:Uma2 family endonuclease